MILNSKKPRPINHINYRSYGVQYFPGLITYFCWDIPGQRRASDYVVNGQSRSKKRGSPDSPMLHAPGTNAWDCKPSSRLLQWSPYIRWAWLSASSLAKCRSPANHDLVVVCMNSLTGRLHNYIPRWRSVGRGGRLGLWPVAMVCYASKCDS